MMTISQGSLIRNDKMSAPVDADGAQAAVMMEARRIIEFARSRGKTEAIFCEFERELVERVAGLGRAVVSLYLTIADQRVGGQLSQREVRGERQFRCAPAQERNLMTWFGLVRYRRTYLREITVAKMPSRGFHPLDASLGLLADRVSPNVLSTAVRMATRMSFSEARDMLGWFLPVVPSTEVIEKALLGYGRHTETFFEQQAPPDDDGEVLVIQADSKGIPMAKAEELQKRRGTRKSRPKAPSPRHRGRLTRQQRIKPPRRKKGDKSKNARLGTMVVMYTLKRQGTTLRGPINKRIFASQHDASRSAPK